MGKLSNLSMNGQSKLTKVFSPHNKTKVRLLPVTLAFLGLLGIGSLLCILSSRLITRSTSSSDKQADYANTLGLNQQQNKLPVAEIARLVTVRIFTQFGAGSGVIIAHQGQTYTVMTCEHVVADSQSDRYTVLTADAVTHPAHRKSIKDQGADLAIVEFESRIPYTVAALGDSDTLSTGERVYASGFPNYQFLDQNDVEDTRDWGTRAFRFTKGEFSLLLPRSLSAGYRLGYTNEVEQGMSGGPVLDESGQVIGINGRLKYPLQGIDVFTFADGTKPSTKLFQQMEALSWAIPITTFRQIAKEDLTKKEVGSRQ